MWSAVLFTALFGFLTVYVMINDGPSVLTVFSLVILWVFSFGIIGALREPPRR